MNKLFLVLMVVGVLVMVGCKNPESGISTDEITLIGTWTANSLKVNNRTVNETLVYRTDGSYSVEGIFAGTHDLLSNGSDTFSFTSDTITYTTDPNKLKTEHYVIDKMARTLTITTNTQSSKIWSRK